MYKGSYAAIRFTLRPLANSIAKFMNADPVTYLSIVLIVPTLYCISFRKTAMAITLFLFSSAFLDWLDGAVAKARDDLNFHDDKVWGGYLDAMSDKIRQQGVSFSLILLTIKTISENHSGNNIGLVGLYLFLFLAFLLIIYELLVGAIRTSTYLKERKRPPNTESPKDEHTKYGKLKTVFQVAGLSFGILGLATSGPPRYWAIYVANVLMTTSFYYGGIGLKEKILKAKSLFT